MSFASLIGSMSESEMTTLQSLADNAPWREVPSRQYDTADIVFWEPCERAFFIRIPPRGYIHRHRDEAIKGVTHHIVLQTNPKAVNWWQEDGQDCCVHLEVGKRYVVQRAPLHWATNDGDTDRIHLLVEYG